jgi:hypothetical protein
VFVAGHVDDQPLLDKQSQRMEQHSERVARWGGECARIASREHVHDVGTERYGMGDRGVVGDTAID